MSQKSLETKGLVVKDMNDGRGVNQHRYVHRMSLMLSSQVEQMSSLVQDREQQIRRLAVDSSPESDQTRLKSPSGLGQKQLATLNT